MKRVFLFIDRNINWFLTIFCIVFCLTMFHQIMIDKPSSTSLLCPTWLYTLFVSINFCIVQKIIGAICFVAMIVFTVLCVRGILNDDRWLIAFISIALIQVLQCVYAYLQLLPKGNDFVTMLNIFFPPFLGLLSCLIFYSGYGLYRLSLRLPPRQHRESKQDQIDRLTKQVEWLQRKIDEEKNKTE